ncbi:MAG TPA: hypothetical protein VL551_04100 [Actinospica sp.]|nr:hypothetical protein [Actinospica sp.]
MKPTKQAIRLLLPRREVCDLGHAQIVIKPPSEPCVVSELHEHLRPGVLTSVDLEHEGAVGPTAHQSKNRLGGRLTVVARAARRFGWQIEARPELANPAVADASFSAPRNSLMMSSRVSETVSAIVLMLPDRHLDGVTTRGTASAEDGTGFVYQPRQRLSTSCGSGRGANGSILSMCFGSTWDGLLGSRALGVI